MRVLCCYVSGGLHPETEAALKEHVCAGERDFRALSEHDPFAYARTLTGYWREGATFLNVEQDVVLTGEILDSLRACTEPLCAGVYTWTTNIGPALGLTCFREQLLAAVPNAIEECGNIGYRQLDYQLLRVVLGRKHGYAPHLHLPPVPHRNFAQNLRPEYAHLSLGDHLAALGYELRDETTAVYVGGPEFGPVRA